MPRRQLRHAIAQAGLTVEEFCRLADVSRSEVYKVIAGQHHPSVVTALAWAELLHTSVEAIFAAPAPEPWSRHSVAP